MATELVTEAIVLQSFDYSENDRIVLFFTRESGKVRGFAKGVKKKKSLLSAAAFLSLNECELTVYNKQNWGQIERCEVTDYHTGFYHDYQLFCQGAYLAELVQLWAVEGESNEPLYCLLSTFLKLLHQKKGEGQALLRIFEILLLRAVGFLPQLEGCAACQGKVVDKNNKSGILTRNKIPFSISQGGVVCKSCANLSETLFIDEGNLRFLRKVLVTPEEKLERLRLPAQANNELKRLLYTYTVFFLGRPVKSFASAHERDHAL